MRREPGAAAAGYVDPPASLRLIQPSEVLLGEAPRTLLLDSSRDVRLRGSRGRGEVSALAPVSVDVLLLRPLRRLRRWCRTSLAAWRLRPHVRPSSPSSSSSPRTTRNTIRRCDPRPRSRRSPSRARRCEARDRPDEVISRPQPRVPTADDSDIDLLVPIEPRTRSQIVPTSIKPEAIRRVVLHAVTLWQRRTLPVRKECVAHRGRVAARLEPARGPEWQRSSRRSRDKSGTMLVYPSRRILRTD